MSSLFLNIEGYSPALGQALDSYLTTSRSSSAFNASQKYRKQLSNFIHVAVFEEDKRYYAREWREFDAELMEQDDRAAAGGGSGGSSTVLNDLLDACNDILEEQQRLAELQQQDQRQRSAEVGTRRAVNRGKRSGSGSWAHTTNADEDYGEEDDDEEEYSCSSASYPPVAGRDYTRPSSYAHASATATAPSPAAAPTPTARPFSATAGAAAAIGSASGDSDQHDLFLILLVEVIYSTLVQQLRTLTAQVLGNRGGALARCRDAYKAHMTSRQLVGGIGSGNGLARFSWASTLFPLEEDEREDCGGENQTLQLEANEIARGASNALVTAATAVKPAAAVVSGIGSYLMAHLSWPLSPLPTAAAGASLATAPALQRASSAVNTVTPQTVEVLRGAAAGANATANATGFSKTNSAASLSGSTAGAAPTFQLPAPLDLSRYATSDSAASTGILVDAPISLLTTTTENTAAAGDREARSARSSGRMFFPPGSPAFSVTAAAANTAGVSTPSSAAGKFGHSHGYGYGYGYRTADKKKQQHQRRGGGGGGDGGDGASVSSCSSMQSTNRPRSFREQLQHKQEQQEPSTPQRSSSGRYSVVTPTASKSKMKSTGGGGAARGKNAVAAAAAAPTPLSPQSPCPSSSVASGYTRNSLMHRETLIMQYVNSIKVKSVSNMVVFRIVVS